jgi:hypothetical protein
MGSSGWSQDQADTLFVQDPEQIIVDASTIKSPTGAMLRSLAVPGWGQFYNEKPLKGIVFAGGQIGLIANAIIQNQWAQSATTPAAKAFYRDNRGLSLWWLAGVMLYSVVDAYVDAHLYGFDSSTSLALNYPLQNDAGYFPICSTQFTLPWD